MNYIHQFKAEILSSTLRKEAHLASAWLSLVTFSFPRKLFLPLDNQTASKILCSGNIQLLKICLGQHSGISLMPPFHHLHSFPRTNSVARSASQFQVCPPPGSDLILSCSSMIASEATLPAWAPSLVPRLLWACSPALLFDPVSPIQNKRSASSAYTACRNLTVSYLSFVTDHFYQDFLNQFFYPHQLVSRSQATS